jgi:hypothetical protein
MFLGSKARIARKADILTAISKPDCPENVRSSTSHNPIGLHILLRGKLYFFIFIIFITEILY